MRVTAPAALSDKVLLASVAPAKGLRLGWVPAKLLTVKPNAGLPVPPMRLFLTTKVGSAWMVKHGVLGVALTTGVVVARLTLVKLGSTGAQLLVPAVVTPLTVNTQLVDGAVSTTLAMLICWLLARVIAPMVQPVGADDVPDELVQRMMRANPIPQPWIEPEDVSRGLLYLVTDPGVVTGSVLEIALGGSARIH